MNSPDKTQKDLKKYIEPYLWGAIISFVILLIVILVLTSSNFLSFIILSLIGCFFTIYFSFRNPLTPYSIDYGSYIRVLEPCELKLAQRKVLTYINSEKAKRVRIKIIFFCFSISILIKLTIDNFRNVKKITNSIEEILASLFVAFFTSLWSFICADGLILFTAYKNWDLIQMTVEPWPIDKPLSKKSKLLSLEDYRKRLIKLSEENDFIREFLETHSFDTLSLFLSDNRLSSENLKKISELENPTEYFEFFEKVSYEDNKFQKFSIGNLIDGFHSRLEEDPETYYESYEKLFMKAEGDLLEVMGKESFNDFILENVEFFIEKMEKDPNWKEKAEKILSVLSKYELKELKKSLPDTSFGREFGEYIERFLEKTPKKRKNKSVRRKEK